MVSPLYGFPVRPLDESVRQQIRSFQEAPDVTCVLDALPHIVLILNARRQVVFANQHLVAALGLASADPVYGRAPGELLDCPNAFEEGGGCGHSDGCQECGAHRAIDRCRQGLGHSEECRILQRTTGRAIDVRVAGTPMRLGQEAFTLLVLTDISNEKRRQSLERVFFHDLLNVVTGIVAYSAVLRRVPEGEVAAEAAGSISNLVHRLADEIRAQRELNEAEDGELQPTFDAVESRALLESVTDVFREHPVSRDRLLTIDAHAVQVQCVTDRVLLARVLNNMVKNALEAVAPGSPVTLGCTALDGEIDFWVHNPGAMSRDVQVQVFRRSFSTKGRGRGLGTYSIKLLTERYLKGRAWFTSCERSGTVFHASIPAPGSDA